MSTNRFVVSAIAAIAGSIAVGPAVAHHSTAAFETTQVVKIEGTIKQFRWINPHASIKIDGGGTVGVWTIEMTAAISQCRDEQFLDQGGPARSASATAASSLVPIPSRTSTAPDPARGLGASRSRSRHR